MERPEPAEDPLDAGRRRDDRARRSRWWCSRARPRCRSCSAGWGSATPAPGASLTPWSAWAWSPGTRARSRAACWSGEADLDRILRRAPAEDEEPRRRRRVAGRPRARLGPAAPRRCRTCSGARNRPMFEIGNTLREARLRRGLDILDCEAETKIRAKYLRAMEEEQFDLMPSPTYVRGFLRATRTSSTSTASWSSTSTSPASATTTPSADRPRPLAVAVGRARHRAASGPPRPPRPAAAAPAPPAHRGPAPLAGDRRRHGRRAARLARRRLGRLGRPRSPEPPATAPRAPRPRPVRAASPTRRPPRRRCAPRRPRSSSPGTGSNGCWVQVRGRDAKGRLVYEGILAPRPRSRSFKVVDGIWLRAANPAELKVTVDGKAVDLGSDGRGNFHHHPDGGPRASADRVRPTRCARRSSSPATRSCAADPGAQRGHPRPLARRPAASPSSGSRSWGTGSTRMARALQRTARRRARPGLRHRRPGADPRRPHDGGGRAGHGPRRCA